MEPSVGRNPLYMRFPFSPLTALQNAGVMKGHFGCNRPKALLSVRAVSAARLPSAAAVGRVAVAKRRQPPRRARRHTGRKFSSKRASVRSRVSAALASLITSGIKAAAHPEAPSPDLPSCPPPAPLNPSSFLIHDFARRSRQQDVDRRAASETTLCSGSGSSTRDVCDQYGSCLGMFDGNTSSLGPRTYCTQPFSRRQRRQRAHQRRKQLKQLQAPLYYSISRQCSLAPVAPPAPHNSTTYLIQQAQRRLSCTAASVDFCEPQAMGVATRRVYAPRLAADTELDVVDAYGSNDELFGATFRSATTLLEREE